MACGCQGSNKEAPAANGPQAPYQGPGTKGYTWNGPKIRNDTGSQSK